MRVICEEMRRHPSGQRRSFGHFSGADARKNPTSRSAHCRSTASALTGSADLRLPSAGTTPTAVASVKPAFISQQPDDAAEIPPEVTRVDAKSWQMILGSAPSFAPLS